MAVSAGERGLEADLLEVLVSTGPNASQARSDVRRVARPLVSVCVVHHERGPLLLQALDSIRKQTLPASQLQAVLVDDGSTSAESLRALDQLATWQEFRQGAWRLLRLPSRYLGAARNAAAREARGEFLFFLDDDNYLKVLRAAANISRCGHASMTTITNASHTMLSLSLCVGPVNELTAASSLAPSNTRSRPLSTRHAPRGRTC